MHTLSRLLVGEDTGEQTRADRRERFREARFAAAERLEADACRNIEDAVEGPAGDELREQGYKMIRQAEALRNGEISLLAAMNLTEGDVNGRGE